MESNMQELLSLLESKVKGLIKERKNLLYDRDMLSQKVIELQDKVDLLTKDLNIMKIDYEAKEQDVMLASMVVEDLLEELDGGIESFSNNIQQYQSVLEKHFQENLTSPSCIDDCIAIKDSILEANKDEIMNSKK